jgi:uncharacterized membrane protein
MTARQETPEAGFNPVPGVRVGLRSALTPAVVQNWSRWAIPMLSLGGMLVSGYLTWIKLARATAFCAGVGNCETVQASRYSEIGGIPVAVLGFGAYTVLFILSVYGPRLSSALATYVPLAIFGIALIGVLFSAYLTYLELVVLHAFCPWCLLSAIIITFIFGFSLRDLGQAVGAGPGQPD